MTDPFGLVYAIVICGLGGFLGKYVFQFLRPELGMIWSDGVAALIAFFVMIMIAALTQALFQYSPIS